MDFNYRTPETPNFQDLPESEKEEFKFFILESLLEKSFRHAKKISQEKEFPGMSVIKITGEVISNKICLSHSYVEQGGNMWNALLKFHPKKDIIEELYDHSKMVLICIVYTIGIIEPQIHALVKLIDIDTQKEICLDIYNFSTLRDKN